MSPISLDAFAKQYPDLRDTFTRLSGWLRNHPGEVIVPKKVAREVRGVDPVSLANALVVLTTNGLLHRFYRVITPSGVEADGEFEDLADIPPKLPDRFEHYFDTAEADIVPVFRREQI